MRVLRNVWFFVLVIVTVEVGWQTSSNAVEKAIKSLQTTMGNKFDKLIAAANAISQGKPTVKPGKFCVDHYEKDWRALLASSLQAAQSAMKLSRLGLWRDRAYRREVFFFRVEQVGKSRALTTFFTFLSVLVS